MVAKDFSLKEEGAGGQVSNSDKSGFIMLGQLTINGALFMAFWGNGRLMVASTILTLGLAIWVRAMSPWKDGAK